jgi:uncharacterized membrane protein
MRDLERSIGRMLIALTYVAVALLAIGVLLLMRNGVSPLSGGPPLDIGSVAGDIAHLLPSGFLWLGLLAVIAAPVSRVVAAAVAYARSGERPMVLVAIAILAVVAVSIGSAIATA